LDILEHIGTIPINISSIEWIQDLPVSASAPFPGAEAARSAQSTIHDASIEDQVLVLQILGESDVENESPSS
jgi:hypothetical protein